MKNKLAILAALSSPALLTTFAADSDLSSPAFQEKLKHALSTLTLSALAAGGEGASANVEVRLIEADLSVTLEQYRKVRAMQREDELAAVLSGKREESEAAQQRKQDLWRYANKLADSARDCGARPQKLRESGPVEAGPVKAGQ